MTDFDQPYSYGVEPVGVVIAGHFSQPETYATIRPQGRADWLITFTLQGQGYFRTPRRELVSNPGDITILRAGVPHEYGTCRGHVWNFVWAHFSPGLVETKYLPEEELFTERIEAEYLRKRIHRAFKRVVQDYREQGRCWNELCESSLREVILLIAQRQTSRIDPRIESALHFMSEHMRDTVRIEDLARAARLSQSRFSHLFKETVGTSVVDTLNLMRLQQAALLLKHTDRTATEVAFDVGFQSYNHFASKFRELYGMSPSVYQKNHSQSV